MIKLYEKDPGKRFDDSGWYFYNIPKIPDDEIDDAVNALCSQLLTDTGAFSEDAFITRKTTSDGEDIVTIAFFLLYPKEECLIEQ